MKTRLETPAEEVARLRRCLNDLISVVALPALWAGGEREQIASTLSDALAGMLRLAFVFVCLNDAGSGRPMEVMRAAEMLQGAVGTQEIAEALRESMGDAPLKWPARARMAVGGEEFSIASARLGINGEIGMLVVGARRTEFPAQTERLVLDVAANQAVIGLQQAHLLSEQKRVARELDERVAQRTNQLAAANEQLRKREYDSRLIVDNIPGLVALLSTNGVIEVVNRQLLEYFGQTLDEFKQWAMNGTIHPEDLPHVVEVFSRSIASGAPYEILQRFRRRDGVYRWFLNSGAPLRDTEGNVVRWCVLLTDIDDRKRAEEALRESEHASRLIVNSIPGLIIVVTPSGDFESVNLPVLEYIGKPLEDVRHWAINDIVHADDRARAVQAVEQSLASGDQVDFEARLRRFDGAYRWFHIRGLPLRDRQGRIVRWYFLNIDVDERKRAEDAVKNSEQNLKLILDTIPALVWCNLPDGPNEFLSKRWNEYTGLTSEESHGWGWQAAMHPDDLPPLMQKWKELMASGEPGEIEVRLRRHDGVYRWFLIRTEPFRAESGKILRWYGTSTDIEDRKRVEEELRRKEDFLASAQRLSMSGSFSWCLDTNEVSFSDEAYRIFGFERDSAVTLEHIESRIHPEDRHLLLEMREAARAEREGQDYPIRLLMPDGSVKYLRTTSSETRDASGRRQYIGALQDVTQRRVAEEALNKARSELAHVSRITSLTELTASIAHEINQPLSGIITNAGTCLRMLDADPPNVDGARETARRTIRDGNRVSDVITRLRALFSKRDFTLESTDLNDATREVIALSLADLQRNQVSVRSELADDLPLVIGDRVQLQQVILNLLRNASDAMADIHDRPRRILIKTECERNSDVRLSVRDAGSGLVGQTIDRIFDSFHTTKSGGMGIGLSVSRSIIERHHGRLWAEPNDGPGATFAFEIPRASEEVSGTAGAERSL